jgi:hypothetical protein
MNQEVKAQWLDALRSGEYQQGKFGLTRKCADGTVRHCCLGVLCDLAVREGVAAAQLGLDGATTYVNPNDVRDYDDVVLPACVTAWAGLNDDGEGCDPKVDDRNLSYWNDCLAADFNDIADMIQEHL